MKHADFSGRLFFFSFSPLAISIHIDDGVDMQYMQHLSVFIFGQVFYIGKWSKISRLWLYWHAGTFDVRPPDVSFTYNITHFCYWSIFTDESCQVVIIMWYRSWVVGKVMNPAKKQTGLLSLFLHTIKALIKAPLQWRCHWSWKQFFTPKTVHFGRTFPF